MQAIQTVYKGCKFRSRLEARWAVFFQTLGVRWNYEEEGFELSNRRYLPDFFLPDHRFYIEIKPFPNPEDMSFLREFARDSGCRVFLFEGTIPRLGDWGYIAGDSAGWCQEFFEGEQDDRLPCICPMCGAFGIEFEGWSDRLKCCGKKARLDGAMNAEDPRLILAYVSARGARFEFEDKDPSEFFVNGKSLSQADLVNLFMKNVKIIP